MLFLGERLRAQCVGSTEVYWEYQAGDDEWHKFPDATSRELESRFMDSSDSDSEVAFTIPVSDPADPRQKVEVALPNANAICESPHGEMFPEGDGSDLSCTAWKVRRECQNVKTASQAMPCQDFPKSWEGGMLRNGSDP